MPKKMRRAALRSALSVKAAENQIVVVDEINLAEPKTRLMIQALNSLVGDASVLILIPEKGDQYDMVRRTINNIPNVKMLMANYLNVRDLLGYDKVVMPVGAIDAINSYLG
jgi:large subunit ribosomal protein L4